MAVTPVEWDLVDRLGFRALARTEIPGCKHVGPGLAGACHDGHGAADVWRRECLRIDPLTLSRAASAVVVIPRADGHRLPSRREIFQGRDTLRHPEAASAKVGVR